MSDALMVKWNLKRLAADLAAHLALMESTNDLMDTAWRVDEFLQPYNLSGEDKYAVAMLALGKQCVDCGDVKDYYMVNNATWRAAGLKPDQNCCAKCLSARLGRPLKPSDFRGAARILQIYSVTLPPGI